MQSCHVIFEHHGSLIHPRHFYSLSVVQSQSPKTLCNPFFFFFFLVWRLKFYLSFVALMYIVRVSSLLLNRLQAVSCAKVVFCVAVWLHACYFPPHRCITECYPSIFLSSFLSRPTMTTELLPLFLGDSSMASNELWRIAPQEEWQPLVMFSPPLSCCALITPTPKFIFEATDAFYTLNSQEYKIVPSSRE